MADGEKKVVHVGPRLSKFIGSKASREKKIQAAAMQAEFTLHDTLVILCYLGRDPDPEISSQARKNLIPAARSWYARPDRPELPEPIYEIVMKVIEKVGLGDAQEELAPEDETVGGNIGLLGLGEIIQAIDHNNRSVCLSLENHGDEAQRATVYTEHGKVVGAVSGDLDGLEALHKAFGWADAKFTYMHSSPGEFKNRIKVNTLTLVMDALEYSPDDDPFESDISKSWRVHGHLRVMNVFEIAEIFEMNSKQAICKLKRDEGEGRLYFNEGRITNASLNDMTGMDAACRLLTWPNAHFVVMRGGEEAEEVIHMGMQNLIIEAMRLLDEGVTVSDKIASELALIDELFEGRDIVTLPVLDKVRMVFSDDEKLRESLETDINPLVRKAIKVKISKTVHKYLNPTTDHQIRVKAAQGKVPLSTTEKLVLLSYLSHDESQEIRETAKETLENLDLPTFRKGFVSDLHPSVMDFLVRETIRDEALIKVAASCETILEETALHILEAWKKGEIIEALANNKKLLERSPPVVARMVEVAADQPEILRSLDEFEESVLQGQGDIKVEGPMDLCGLTGIVNAVRQGGRSGTLMIEKPGNTGRVFFHKGKVVGAVAGDMEGLPALKSLFTWEGSRFRYVLRTHFHARNIESTAAEAFLETQPPSETSHEIGSLRVISGSLKCMDIFEGLAMMEGTSRPVTMNVVCEEGSGEIIRDRSRILHAAVVGKDDPFQALAAMLAWQGIRFIIRPTVGEFPVTVDKSLGDFFTESTKLIPDEILGTPRPGELPEWELSEEESESLYHRISQMGIADKVKLAFMGNKEARSILVRDPVKMVAVAVVISPKIREDEIENITKSRQVCDDVLRQIAATKEWMKSYTVKLNLANNSKTPLPISMKLLPHFREQDLRKLARSKNIPAALATQARRLAETKSGG